MLNYLDKLSAPEWLVIIIIGLAVVTDVVSWLSKIWGVFAPKIFKISTSISRKKEIDKIILSNQLEIQKLKTEQLKDREESKKADQILQAELDKTDEKLDKISDLVLNIRIENMRKTLLEFASGVGSGRKYTKEQYDEMFYLYGDYEALLAKNSMTNGRINISMEIVTEKYKHNLVHGGFLDDSFRREQ